MPIPPQQRVIYRRNPLQEVICQIRFPRLLEIETEVPAQFQSIIRDRYPILAVRNRIQILQMLADGSAVNARVETPRIFDFSSTDGKWKASLSADFVSLVTTDYPHWDAFRDRLSSLVEAVRACYKPAVFTRIGIRYKDSISRRRFGLDGVPWHELIEPRLAGILSAGSLGEAEVSGFMGSFSFPISETARAQTQYGLVAGQDEQEFLVDTDFYTEQQTEATTDAAIGTIEGFRPFPYDLFRWCISDRLHQHMEPSPP